MTFGIELTCLAKFLASNLKGHFIYLSVALDEIYRSSIAVGKGGPPTSLDRETKTLVGAKGSFPVCLPSFLPNKL